MKRIFFIAVTILFLGTTASNASTKQILTSPNGRISVNVDVADGIRYSVSMDGVTLINPSEIFMILEDGTLYGGPGRGYTITKHAVDETINAVAYRKAEVRNHCNEMIMKSKKFSVIFRAYDDGIAYRFVSASDVPFKVTSERAEFNFSKDYTAYIPYVQQNDESLETQFHNSFENKYTHQRISEFDKTHYAFLPVLVEAENGVKMVVSESDLLHYPGMHIYNGDGDTSFEGVFAPYPKNRIPEPNSNRQISMYVDGVEDFISKCEPHCSFPWRLVAISTSDEQLTNNDMVYRLASAQEPSEDFSWVKPGKVAWDWWNSWNLYGVDFKSGVNTETYKYYIDFASKHGIEYVILDEGWSPGDLADLTKVIPEVDLDELLRFGEEKGVGIILWAGFYPFQKDIEGICKFYSAKGVKGFKVDFMDSDDQGIPEFLEKCAAAGAKYHLMMDFHGIYKPTGLSRKYPNVVNYEGIYGLEQMKWGADPDQVDYDVTVPFIRLFAGPADYTQGAMRNASYRNVRAVSSEGMSPGTRCRQLAEYVVFFSPLNMLCDSPSNYMGEPECTEFIAGIPTVWDETLPLQGKVAEYIAVARRAGDEWYVGAMTDWTARDMTLDLSFLGEGEYEMVIFRDGVNADKAARDYRKLTAPVPADRQVNIHLAPGGGYAAHIVKK